MQSLELWDWRRRVSDLYTTVRGGAGDDAAWRRWRTERDELFATHPQSPLQPGRRLAWFPYDPAWRLSGEVDPANVDNAQRLHTAEGTFGRMGTVRFTAPDGRPAALALWWLDAYAGGVFLPFRDATAGNETYGGGRYLLDTAKGADLGHSGSRVTLDFNYAYHPSCAHDPKWSCPLAPEENRLETAVRAGERLVS